MLNQFNPAIALLTASSWVPLLLLESGFIARLTPAVAQQRLPAPEINEELPSLSPSPIPSLESPPPPQNTLPNSPPAERELNFQAPEPPIQPRTPTPTVNFYRVDIYGDSPGLLAQVQQIEPEAFVREGEGVIQAGVFSDRYNALSRVRALAAQGIRARVTPISGSASTPPVSPGRLARVSSYFVIIPGDARDLPEIAARVVQLGVGRNAVNQRDAPRGAHVAIGPFSDRGAADRWSSYLRSVGMDARVYFGR